MKNHLELPEVTEAEVNRTNKQFSVWFMHKPETERESQEGSSRRKHKKKGEKRHKLPESSFCAAKLSAKFNARYVKLLQLPDLVKRPVWRSVGLWVTVCDFGEFLKHMRAICRCSSTSWLWNRILERRKWICATHENVSFIYLTISDSTPQKFVVCKKFHSWKQRQQVGEPLHRCMKFKCGCQSNN